MARASHIALMPTKPVSLSRTTPWRDVIVLCRKCGKKRRGGFGPKRKQTLKETLRQTLREIGQRRQVRVMETECLGLCPKNGITALNATRPGTIHVIPVGSDGTAAVRTLLGDHAVADIDRIEAA